MNQLTQQNAANSEESASAAEEMTSQAQELAAMVGSFALSNGSSTLGTQRRHKLAFAHQQQQQAQPAQQPLLEAQAPDNQPLQTPVNPLGGNGNSKHVQPEDVIPMDDVDLKGF
jgi:hypothetical protein